MKLATLAAAIVIAGGLQAAQAAPALSSDAADAMSGPIYYLPGNGSNPGGVKGYDHDRQFNFDIESDKPGKNQAERDKIKKTPPKKAVTGPQVKSGTYTLGTAPGAD